MSRRRDRDEDLLAIEAPPAKRAHVASGVPDLPMEILLHMLERNAMDNFKTICPEWEALAALIVKHQALLSGPILLGAWCGEDEAWGRAPSRVLKVYVRPSDAEQFAGDAARIFAMTSWPQEYGYQLVIRLDLVMKIISVPLDAATSLWALREWHATRANMLTPLGWISWSALSASTDRLQLYSPNYSTRLMIDRLWAKVLWFNPKCDAFRHPQRWLDSREQLETHPAIYPALPDRHALAVHGKVAHVYLSRRSRVFKWCMRGYATWKLGLCSLHPPRFPTDLCAEWSPATLRIVEFGSVSDMFDYACRLVPLHTARRLMEQREAIRASSSAVTIGVPSCQLLPPSVSMVDANAWLVFEHGHMAHGTILIYRKRSFCWTLDSLDTNGRILDLTRRYWTLNPSGSLCPSLFDAMPWSLSSTTFLRMMEQLGGDSLTCKTFQLDWTFRFSPEVSMMAQLVLEFLCQRAASAMETTILDIAREFPSAEVDPVMRQLEPYLWNQRRTEFGLLSSGNSYDCVITLRRCALR